MARKKREDQMDMFEMGGLKDEGGSVDPVSGNDVPNGSLKEEVRDDIDAKLSEGEFVLPADVVRYIGLENIMKMRDMAKEGLAKMEAMGQMGNSEEATMDDETDFDSDIDSFIEDLDKEDDPAEYQVGGYVGGVGGLSGYQLSPTGMATPASTGFVPPGVVPYTQIPSTPGSPVVPTPGSGGTQAPTVDTSTVTTTTTEAPDAPVITQGDGSGGLPTYETKQYIGPNGDIITITFINGDPFPEIPEGYTLYDPAKIPETKTKVPTAKVTEKDDGGDSDTQVESAKVDPTTGIASALAQLDPDSNLGKLAKEQQELDDKALKRGGLALLGGLMSGGISLLGLGFVGFKYANESSKIQQKIQEELDKVLDPATKNIIKDAGMLDPNSYTNKAIEQTFVNATKAGASPALAAALATTTSRAFSEVDPDSDLATYEMQTADIFRDVTGGALDVGSAQTAMLTEQDFGLFDSAADRAAFYSQEAPSRGDATPTEAAMSIREGATPSTREQRTGRTTSKPTAQFDTFTQGIFDAEAGARLGEPGTYVDAFGNVTSTGPVRAGGFTYDMDTLLAGTQTPSVTVTRTPDPSVTLTSIRETEQQAKEVSSGDRDLGGSDFGSQSEADAVANDGWGSDAHFDAIDDQFESNDSSGGDGGGGSYCCTKMVQHELWTTRREFAMMHKWHREQPQWWRDGYDVWGNVVAETLLKKKTKFWTSVMQSFYDYHVKKKPRTLKSVLADAIIYPGVVAFGLIAKFTGRHINAV